MHGPIVHSFLRLFQNRIEGVARPAPLRLFAYVTATTQQHHQSAHSRTEAMNSWTHQIDEGEVYNAMLLSTHT